MTSKELPIIALRGRSSDAVARTVKEALDTGADAVIVQLEPGSLIPLSLPTPARGESMVYCDYIADNGSTIELIDRQEGALRDDFEYGPAVVVSRHALTLAELMPGLKGAGLYDLTLALSRLGTITHHTTPGYRFIPASEAGSTSQFDYVDPRNRAVQLEMEKVVTHHLGLTDALVDTTLLDTIDPESGGRPVEASVIIPVRNRIRTIGDAVRSALSQETDFPYNVIVIDNHSTDGTTALLEKIASEEPRLVHIIPDEKGHGIGGCWEIAVNSEKCGRYAVQLDSDDLYAGTDTLQRVVDRFRETGAAMVVGSYTLTDFNLAPIPPGIIDHREWTDSNGPNNALRVNGLGAPRAFVTDVIRRIGFPDVSYGEDYAAAIALSRRYRIARIFDPVYICRRWEGNSDAALDRGRANANNLFKDSARTAEFNARRHLTPDRLTAHFGRQLEASEMFRKAYAALDTTEQREMVIGGERFVIQFNPSRARSTMADVSPRAIAERPCFLCRANRPSEQAALRWEDLEILVNPYPASNPHFTAVCTSHTPQRLAGRVRQMARLASRLPGFTVFFNGARSGASAPDHFHFQIVADSAVPAWDEKPSRALVTDSFSAVEEIVAASGSDMLNVLCHSTEEGVIFLMYARRRHRPDCWERLMVSPASLDLAGRVITARREDYDALDPATLADILDQVTAAPPEPGNISPQKRAHD